MKATWTLPDGSTKTADVAIGTNLMEAAVANDIPNIEGACGGCLSCATCHVVVDADWFAKTGAPGEDEVDMLDLAFGLAQTSSLGCQIEMSDALDGLRVTIPEDM